MSDEMHPLALEPSACGWCGRPVVWPVEGKLHSFGRCVDGELAAIAREKAMSAKVRKAPKPPPEPSVSQPTTVLTIRWEPGIHSGEEIRRRSRAMAERISKVDGIEEAHVATFGTVGLNTHVAAPPDSESVPRGVDQEDGA